MKSSSLTIRTCIKVQVHPKIRLAKKADPAAYFSQNFDHYSPIGFVVEVAQGRRRQEHKGGGRVVTL